MTTQRDQAYDLGDPMFATDDFRCFRYKVELCPRGRPHDWTQCPYAHPQEKAKRRDPKQFKYSGTACQTFRKSGSCERGDSCPYAHGVFECWLHPARYRTQMCTDGKSCNRRVCFFAHDESEIRTQPVDALSGESDNAEKAEFSKADVPLVLEVLKKLLASQSTDASTQALQRGLTSLLAQQQQKPATFEQQKHSPTISAPLQAPTSGEVENDFSGGAAQPLMQQLAQNAELRHLLLQAMIQQEANQDQLFDRNLYLSQNPNAGDNLDPMVMSSATPNNVIDVATGVPQMQHLPFEPGSAVLGMYGNGMAATADSALLMSHNSSTASLNNLLANAGASFPVHAAADTQRRSIDIGEVAHRRNNYKLQAPVPSLFGLQAKASAGQGVPASLFARDNPFAVTGPNDAAAGQQQVGALRPSTAAHQAAALLLDGVHRSRGVAPRNRLARPAQHFGQAMYSGPTDAAALLPSQIANLAQLNLQARSGTASSRSSLDMQPPLVRPPPSEEPRRYSVDIAGHYGPAIQTSLPTAEAALIAGPDAYSRVGTLAGFSRLSDQENRYVNGFNYPGLIDSSTVGFVPDHPNYSIPLSTPPNIPFCNEMGMEVRGPLSVPQANGGVHLNGAGSPGPKVAAAGVNYCLNTLHALQHRFSLEQAVKRADSFDQILKDMPQCESGLRESGLRYEEAIHSPAG